MRILLTRPEAAALPLKEKLEAEGHEVALAPVLSIEPVKFSLDQRGLGGVVLTSASAAPALTRRDFPRDITIYAIGTSSAEAARRQGFANIIAADGERRRFTALIVARHDPAAGHLLHLAGGHRAGDIVAELQALGLEAKRVRVYEAVAASSLPAHIRDQIKEGNIDAVLFFSPRSAETFLSLAAAPAANDDFSGALLGMAALCLSDAVAAAATAGNRARWKSLHVAGALSEAAMIAALENIQVGSRAGSRNGG